MKIVDKIIKAKGGFKPIPERGFNPHYKVKFAKLADIIEAVEEPLNKEGVIVVNLIEGDRLITKLLDAEGGEVSSAFPLPETRNDPQKLGAAISYGRRYNLSALLNLREEDDDGESVNGRGHQGGSKPLSPAARKGAIPEPKPSEPTAQQMEENNVLLRELGWSAEKGASELLAMFGVKSRRQLTTDQMVQFNLYLRTQLE